MRKEEPCRWEHRQTPMERMAERERGHRRKMSSYSRTYKGDKKDVRDLRDALPAADTDCGILPTTLPCSAEPGPYPGGAGPAVARGRQNPPQLLSAGSLREKVRPRGKQTGTPIRPGQFTQQTRLSGTHLPQKSLRRGGERMPHQSRGEASPREAWGSTQPHTHSHTHQPSCLSKKTPNKQKPST